MNVRAEGRTANTFNKNLQQSPQIVEKLSRFVTLKHRAHVQSLAAFAGNVELKSFVKSGNSPRGFSPLLSHLVNAHELLLHSDTPVGDALKNTVLFHPRQVRYGFGKSIQLPHRIRTDENGVPSPFINKHYYKRDIIAVSFRPATTRYYQSAGFEVVDWPEPQEALVFPSQTSRPSPNCPKKLIEILDPRAVIREQRLLERAADRFLLYQ